MKTCPSEEELTKLAAGGLSPDEKRGLEDHVQACPPCQELLARLQNKGGTLLTRTDSAAETPGENMPSGSAVPPPSEPVGEAPVRIGKYRVVRELGGGTFGRVYLAEHPELGQRAAIKVPVLPTAGAREQFLREARVVARLRHANIVPVHDVGLDPAAGCYIVYEYIDGKSLKERLKAGPLPPMEAARLAAPIADALHYAHLNGLIHRDIKPDNVLVDEQGRPYVADFGIAVHEDELAGERGILAGTLPYMAPEQIRREGHRIDGRTDVYSLGIMLYEMLCGKRPFAAQTYEELQDQIQYREARPPRQVNDAIPRELERICLKALSKRITDRYPTAHDMAADLRAAMERDSMIIDPGKIRPIPDALPRVVPKGLRSFAAEDSDFFMQLLPGPRDRDGLPEAVKFWKVRLESTDPDRAFRVGLVHGPSGCGKTSLIRAGLLPRLARNVVPVYVETLPEGTEIRILGRLQWQWPELNKFQDLAAAMAGLRHGTDPAEGQKILIVLDQFEQWLLANGARLGNNALVPALRQADGARLQVLLMVRDDFWSAVVRLFNELEIIMDSEKNVRMMDLFDPRHARHVLELFGQAYDVLPADSRAFTREQNEFLDQAVAGLSQDGKVISVRLSLFADMMKSRPWTPAALKEVGGTEGVGVTFLEETFSASTAPPQHRQEETHARGMLAALLPDAGTDIKGRMRAREELLEASGLTLEPERFERLVQMLNQELRIITPVEAAGSSTAMSAAEPAYYQLTHDYLVSPLREWLRRKKKETWRGRAELRLLERTAEWTAGRQRRFLPSFFEYLRITLGVPRRRQTSNQRALMRASTRYYGTWLVFLLLVAAIAGWLAREIHGSYRARALVAAICTASPAQADLLLEEEFPRYRNWGAPLLLAMATDPEADRSRRVRASLGCLPEQVNFLADHLLGSSLDEFPVICKRLKPYSGPLLARLWHVLRDDQRPDREQFYAGMALAWFAPEAGDWTEKESVFLARHLLVSNPEEQKILRAQLRPMRKRLVVPLQTMFEDTRLDPALRQAAAAALVDYAPEQVELLTQLACRSLPGQYRLLFHKILARPENHQRVVKTLMPLVAGKGLQNPTEKVRVKEGKQRALAAITLMRLGEWRRALPALRVESDPEAQSQFLVHARDFDVQPDDLARGVEPEMEESVRFACLLALGNYPFEEVPSSQALLRKLADWHAQDPLSSIHAACEWLQAKWGRGPDRKKLAASGLPPVHDPYPRQWFTLGIGGETFSFVVFPPGKFLMGSPEEEELRVTDEKYKTVRFTRPLAVADREITVGQWLQFLESPEARAIKLDRPTWEKRDKGKIKFLEPWRPAYFLNWLEGVEYCRWLTRTAGLGEKDQCYEKTGTAVVGKTTVPVYAFFPERRGFRLPTEAEWEFACRSGTVVTTFGFGSDYSLLKDFTIFLDNSGRKPHRGGSRRPSLRGLFDMHGNVWEWCHDWYSKDHPGDAEILAPGGPDTGETRLYRGGSFDNYSRHCRCACRISDQPSYAFNFLGLRVVCTLAPAP